MNVEVGRRVFVGSVVAGLPLLAGAGKDVAWAQNGRAAAPLQDPVLDQLQLDVKRAVKALSKSRSGEHARRLSSSLRLLAAWGASAQLDARVKDTLRGAIARDGRDAVLWRNVDAVKFRADARDLGFDGSSLAPLPTLPAVDYRTREIVLNDILENGVTARWRKAADTLDAAGTALDLRTASTRGAVTLAAQLDPEICAVISQQMFWLNVEMAFWCAPWFWWFPYGCLYTSSAFLGIAIT
jgi:hypothetical protein